MTFFTFHSGKYHLDVEVPAAKNGDAELEGVEDEVAGDAFTGRNIKKDHLCCSSLCQPTLMKQ